MSDYQRHMINLGLREPHQVSESVHWSNDPDPDKSLIKVVYNWRKRRRETWQRKAISHEWVLWDVTPGRNWKESFVGPVQFVPAILGLFLDRAWDTSGNPAPAAGNFVALGAYGGEVGGGMVLRCLGVADNDWISFHMGNNYPVTIGKSPHIKLTADLIDTDELYFLAGLVGISNLETANGNPWTIPDDGIWVEYDTDVDNQLHFVTSNGGTRTQTPLGTPPIEHTSMILSVKDDCDEVEAIMNNYKVASHTTNLPDVDTQLKALMMLGTRVDAGGVQKDIHVHDLRLIFDRGLSVN